MFKQFFDPASSTYTYLLTDQATHVAMIVDPVLHHVDEYVEFLHTHSLELRYSFDTHVHADHITGAARLRALTGCQTVMHKATQADCASITLEDGETVMLGKTPVRLIHTPGHTPCSSSYLVNDRLFTGDSLLILGCGRTDFQQGSAQDQWHSVTQKLFSLAEETLVYPGHDYHQRRVSCIGQEKALNPRFANQTLDSFVELMRQLNLPEPKLIHEAVPANKMCGASGSHSL